MKPHTPRKQPFQFEMSGTLVWNPPEHLGGFNVSLNRQVDTPDAAKEQLRQICSELIAEIDFRAFGREERNNGRAKR